MSPIVPFTAEMLYQNLKTVIGKDSEYNKDSVHFIDIPKFNENLIDEAFEESVNNMQRVINLARKMRENKKISLK